jgi:hypothetical protein
MQVLVSWECTIAHAVPWAVFNPWIAKDTPVSRFMAAITAASVAYEHKVQRPLLLLCLPPCRIPAVE